MRCSSVLLCAMILLSMHGLRRGFVFASGDATCDSALARYCDSARKLGVMACARCGGEHQAELLGAGCENDNITAFCYNQTCACQLEDKCAGTKGQCAQCTFCANQQRLCGQGQRESFCDASCRNARTCGEALETIMPCQPQARTNGVWQVRRDARGQVTHGQLLQPHYQ